MQRCGMSVDSRFSTSSPFWTHQDGLKCSVTEYSCRLKRLGLRVRERMVHCSGMSVRTGKRG